MAQEQLGEMMVFRTTKAVKEGDELLLDGARVDGVKKDNAVLAERYGIILEANEVVVGPSLP